MRRSLDYETPSPLRERLVGVFSYRARGRAGALKLRELLVLPGVGEHGERAVRRAIQELVVLDRLPIAGDAGAGYYLCETWAERQGQLHQLWGRVLHLMDRADTYAAASAAFQGRQGEMDYSLEPTAIADLQRRQLALRQALDGLEPGDEEAA